MFAVRGVTWILVLALGMLASPVLAAGPKIKEVVQVYTVDAMTVHGLKQQFRTKGPKGFTGLTRWEVRWDAACKVEVTLTYTFPKHANPKAMPAKVRRKYFRLLANLYAHEWKHGQHGIRAAREISRAGCKDAAQIIRRYNRADKELDRRTRNGRSDGVTLN